MNDDQARYTSSSDSPVQPTARNAIAKSTILDPCDLGNISNHTSNKATEVKVPNEIR